MSLSLSAVQADGYYQPADFDPKKHKTLNRIHGTHRLGDRAKKIHEGIITIRFEMPYKVWCLGCDRIIAKGVRFDAEKKSVGKFHSTTIWEFSMKCHSCPQILVIRTDPENSAYVCFSGCREKVETFTSDQISGHKFRSEEELLKIDRDPLKRLEVRAEDLIETKNSKKRIEELYALNDHDDFEMNKKMRSRLRPGRNRQRAEELNRNFVLPLESPTSGLFEIDRDAQSQMSERKVRKISAKPEGSKIFPGGRKDKGVKIDDRKQILKQKILQAKRNTR